MVLGFASSHVQHNGFLRTGLTRKSDSMGKHSLSPHHQEVTRGLGLPSSQMTSSGPADVSRLILVACRFLLGS